MSSAANPSLNNHDPTKYSTNASFVYSSSYIGPVLGLLDAQPGEKIIDLGCGTGEITRLIAGIVGEAGKVVGVDSSESMLAKASSSPSSPHIPYIQADIQDLASFASAHPELEGAFDKVFTSATLHWCKSPDEVVLLVRWLLRPGGRMAFEFGGFGCCVGVRAALHQAVRRRGVDPLPLDPFYFPTAAQYEQVLQGQSLTPEGVHLVPRPTPLPTDLKGWLSTFARSSFLASFSDSEADAIMDDVVDQCRVDLHWSFDHPGIGVAPPGSDRVKVHSDQPKREGWEVMYVRIRGVAVKSS